MNFPALACILFGAFVAAARAPLIVAPDLTRRIYLELIETSLRVRFMGMAVTAIGIIMIAAGQRPSDFIGVLALCTGWVLALIGFFGMVVGASLVRTIALSLLENADPLVLRGLGLASVAFGIFYLYLGIVAW